MTYSGMVLEDTYVPARLREPVVRILGLIPKGEHRAFVRNALVPLIEKKYDISADALEEMEFLISKMPDEARGQFFRVCFTKLAEEKPGLSEESLIGMTNEIWRMARVVPRKHKGSFISGCMWRALNEELNIPLEGLYELGWTVARNLRKSTKEQCFLDESALKHIQSIWFQGSCESTKRYFLDDLGRGMLIKAHVQRREWGWDKTLYIKGMWSTAGHVLAYEPLKNEVWAVKIEDGKIVDVFRKHRFEHEDLQAAFGVPSCLDAFAGNDALP